MSRTREQAQGPVTGIASKTTDKGSGPYGTDYTVTLSETSEIMTDVVTTSFSEKSNEGEIVINPCVHVKETLETIGSGHYTWLRTNGDLHDEVGPGLTDMQIQRYPGYMQGIPAEPEPSYNMVEAAKLQAFGNIDRSPYGFAEDIAEMRETLKFLRDPLKSLSQLAELMRAKANRQLLRKSNILSYADVMSDLWLEYQFAMSPLARSAYDLVQSVVQKEPVRPKRRLARGGSEFSDKAANSGVKFTWRSSATIGVKTEVHAGIWYEHANPIVDWRYKYGLRFKDIPETLWAIVPLSFMVDRVLDISKSMRGLVAFLDPSVKILGAWTSEKKEVTTTRTWEGHVSPIVQSVLRGDLDTISVKTESYSREPWEPALGDLIPEFRVGNLADTSIKIADLAALIWSNLRNR